MVLGPLSRPLLGGRRQPHRRGLGERVQELIDRVSKQFRRVSRRVEEGRSGRVRMSEVHFALVGLVRLATR